MFFALSRFQFECAHMPGSTKSQRIRDPLHNLIEFDSEQFEHTLWQVIQTKPFQRLRRIRQLGFSELVFPGATHTRFAHSIGVFHTARTLLAAIEPKMGKRLKSHQREVALAASLVHDVGHGMFSHSFEEVGKALNLPMARHETVSEALIRDGSGAMDSSVMYLLETAHSSFAREGWRRRAVDGGFVGKATTLVRRLTSAWSRSIGLECNAP